MINTRTQILTLLTDFGLQDTYVGQMKGVIAQINPHLQVVDLTHNIPPQNLLAGHYCLMSTYQYFPVGSVHVAVVDPGVGSQRRAVAVQIPEGYLVGPDNGLLSGVLSQSDPWAAVELTNPKYWRTSKLSTTFHGRDLFAPVAAHLASGVLLQDLGKAIDPTTLIPGPLLAYSQSGNRIQGTIQYIDHFGNLITTLPATLVQNRRWQIQVQGQVIPGGQTFSDVPVGALISYVGSQGWVEMAVNQGNAAQVLQVTYADEVICQMLS
ncbi:MAG: SAM-dependent chlorinase/fluorinase [Synechococcaceae cyanobacterium SM2_3_1]|nr:SAM-dependent chlorinase/fluorinase [Synechococcaceae cyanobacterium SM2_3_1]